MVETDSRRVLVLNHFAVPRGQAGGTRHMELFTRLEGWQFLIVAGALNPLTGETQPAEPGFLPVRVSPYRSNGWRRVLNWISYSASAFLRSVTERRIDLVYASSPHLLAALAGWGVAVVRRVPFVFEVRDLWPRVLVDMGQLSERSQIYRTLQLLEVFLYKRADAIIVMAEGSRDVIVKHGISAERVFYVPNGADSEDFEPSAARETLRARYGFRRFTAVYAGAHGPANGLELVLEAAAEVAALNIDIVLVGGGVAKSGLVAKADSMGLENVRFLDPIPKAEIPDLLHASDIGLHILADVELFRYGVSPNKMFDYMAAGLPVLTNCPGLVSELVVESRCGLAVAPNQIGVGLQRMIGMRESSTLSEMGATGRRWIDEHQSRSAMAKRLGVILAMVAGDDDHSMNSTDRSKNPHGSARSFGGSQHT